MNFIDIFKKSFLEGYASANLTVKSILICMLVTILISAYIFMVYRLMNRNTFYNKNFNMSLPAIAIITAAIILTIQSNIVISLGMIGALSIVRFRTAIKDPMDLVYLFWAISVGIICGAGFAIIAVIASTALTVGILLADWIPIAKTPQILLINSDSFENEEDILKVVKKYCSLHKVKARNLTHDHIDMAIEVRVKEEGELVKELMQVENVTSASLVSHDGEVTF
ncbi:MAG: DUF4956 domain-containing protein [Lachnospiraceae bacterium]|nr:DUF4956 domain-containing protein [Lachnospiraceae bacterium]MDD7628511.1 DUF4956 domain-containing protein [Lachnospiraceae bacterium]MDY4120037.1 DUF4956 domain-containing protein [Lachnospiraceae bacterium]